jgi:diacylglycerol kinase (ATP)
MANPDNVGIRRLVNATVFSVFGLRSAWHNEAAFRQECIAAIMLAPAALWLGQTGVQRALLIVSCWLVVVVELLNSAIETVVDRIGTDRHRLSGRAKDMGSAAVFVSILLTSVVWALIAWQRFG